MESAQCPNPQSVCESEIVKTRDGSLHLQECQDFGNSPFSGLGFTIRREFLMVLVGPPKLFHKVASGQMVLCYPDEYAISIPEPYSRQIQSHCAAGAESDLPLRNKVIIAFHLILGT